MRLSALLGIALAVVAPTVADAAPPAGHDFITEARQLLVLGVCALLAIATLLHWAAWKGWL